MTLRKCRACRCIIWTPDPPCFVQPQQMVIVVVGDLGGNSDFKVKCFRNKLSSAFMQVLVTFVTNFCPQNVHCFSVNIHAWMLSLTSNHLVSLPDGHK